MKITVEKINMVLNTIAWTSVAIVVVIVLSFLWKIGASFNVAHNELSKGEIFGIVEENYEALMDYIQTGNLEYANKIKGIERVSSNEKFIEFDCGGRGMGSETSYWGFYYSPEDSVSATEGYNYPKGEAMSPYGNGWSWQETDGDNKFYVEKIMDNFFYYESHY